MKRLHSRGLNIFWIHLWMYPKIIYRNEVNHPIQHRAEIIKKLEIRVISNDSLDFVLISKNKNNGISSTIKGVAITYGNSLGTNEDKEGNAFLVKEYFYESETCWLEFHYDIDTKTRIKIYESDCLRHDSTPYATIDFLNRDDSLNCVNKIR